jgi:hypothetical protein
MNIYRATDAPFPSTFLEYAQVFAGHAAVAVANITSHANAVNEATHLRKALESWAIIEQARKTHDGGHRSAPPQTGSPPFWPPR